MNRTLTREEMEQFEVNHDHGGNGWFVIEDIDEDYCRLAAIRAPINGRQAFLAWKPKLSVFMLAPAKGEPPVPVRLDKHEKEWAEICELRQKLRTGELVIKNTHLVAGTKRRKIVEETSCGVR